MAQFRYTAYFSLCARLVIAAALFFGGIAIGQYTETFLPGAPQSYADVTDLAKGYKYINPLLFCSDREFSRSTNALSRSIETQVATYIERQKSAGRMTAASVYYRDLNSGPWALVSGDLRSAPASLLKVPLAMSIYRRAQDDPSFLAKKIDTPREDQNADVHFKPPRFAEPGAQYAIEELVGLSIRDSDNNATAALIGQLRDEELRSAYADLGIEVPADNPGNYTISVRTYASFFRILFNASYLSRGLSERLLAHLAMSDFNDGLRPGVPGNVQIAHKFGEHRIDDSHVQLHDCGIVYDPQKPYLLCVMTQGTNYVDLAASIREISTIVWTLHSKR